MRNLIFPVDFCHTFYSNRPVYLRFDLLSPVSGAPARPTDLNVSNVTDTSAVVTWLPSNSNLEHRVSVNNQSSAVIRPGIYRCLLSG